MRRILTMLVAATLVALVVPTTSAQILFQPTLTVHGESPDGFVPPGQTTVVPFRAVLQGRCAADPSFWTSPNAILTPKVRVDISTTADQPWVHASVNPTSIEFALPYDECVEGFAKEFDVAVVVRVQRDAPAFFLSQIDLRLAAPPAADYTYRFHVQAGFRGEYHAMLEESILVELAPGALRTAHLLLQSRSNGPLMVEPGLEGSAELDLSLPARVVVPPGETLRLPFDIRSELASGSLTPVTLRLEAYSADRASDVLEPQWVSFVVHTTGDAAPSAEELGTPDVALPGLAALALVAFVRRRFL